MSTPDKCPFCNAELDQCINTLSQKAHIYKCGVWSITLDSRSSLCHALERANKAEAECADLSSDLYRALHGKHKAEAEVARLESLSWYSKHRALQKENAKLKDILQRAIENAQALYDNPTCEDHDIGQCRYCHEGSVLWGIKKEYKAL